MTTTSISRIIVTELDLKNLNYATFIQVPKYYPLSIVLEYSSTGIALYNCILHFTLQLHSTLLFVYLSKHELHLLRYHEFLYRKTILKSSLHY